MNSNGCLLAILLLVLFIMMVILIKPYLNKNNVVTDSDICIRIPFLCCSYHYPIYLSYFIHNACFFMMQLYGDQ